MDVCISLLVRLFFNCSMNIYAKDKLFVENSFLLQFLNALICSAIALFFQVHQIPSDIVLILYNKPCTITGVYSRFIVENRDNI